MIKVIKPNNLNGYLWRTGPYLYYYNDRSDENNKYVVKNMKFLSIQCPKLNIFEIDWKQQINFDIFTKVNYKNTIFLYFKGERIKELFEPKIDQLQELFNDCLKYQKERLERYFINQGSKLRGCPLNQKDEKLQSESEMLGKTQLWNIRRRQMDIAREWKNLSITNVSITTEDVKHYLTEKTEKIVKNIKKDIKHNQETESTFKRCNTQIYNRKNNELINFSESKNIQYQNQKENNKITNIKRDMIEQSSKQWFTDIELINQLPNEFLDESFDDSFPVKTQNNKITTNDKYQCSNNKTKSNIIEYKIKCRKMLDSVKKFNNNVSTEKIKNRNSGLSKYSHLANNKNISKTFDDKIVLNLTENINNCVKKPDNSNKRMKMMSNETDSNIFKPENSKE